MPRMVRIAGRNREAHVRHRNRQQPLLGSALGQHEAHLGLVGLGSLAVGRVVHFEHQVGSSRNQLGRPMVFVKVLAMLDVPALVPLDGAGLSFGLPSGAPASAHAESLATSASLRRRSLAKCPYWGSANQGGILRVTTAVLMASAHGRVLS